MQHSMPAFPLHACTMEWDHPLHLVQILPHACPFMRAPSHALGWDPLRMRAWCSTLPAHGQCGWHTAVPPCCSWVSGGPRPLPPFDVMGT